MAQKLKVQLIRSTIGILPKQRATVRSLGLRKIGSVTEHKNIQSIQGMIKVVAHLVSVEEIE